MILRVGFSLNDVNPPALLHVQLRMIKAGRPYRGFPEYTEVIRVVELWYRWCPSRPEFIPGFRPGFRVGFRPGFRFFRTRVDRGLDRGLHWGLHRGLNRGFRVTFS